MKKQATIIFWNIIISFFFIAFGQQLRSQTTYTWTGNDGNWSVDTNWDTGISPGATVNANDLVIINKEVTVTVDIKITNNGTIVICSNSASPQGADNPTGGNLEIGVSDTLDNQGELWIYYLYNQTTDDEWGIVTNLNKLFNSGTIELFDGYIENYGIFTNSGTINARLYGYCDNTGTMLNTTTGVIILHDESTLDIWDGGAFTNEGLLTIQPDAAIWIDGEVGSLLNNNGTINNNGLTELSDGGIINNTGIFNQSGKLEGVGTYNGDLVNEPSGTITPGDLTGLLTVNGNFTNNGTLRIPIAGTQFDASNKEYSRLKIDGAGHSATLSGTLGILLSNFTPTDGDNFRIIETASGVAVSGTFATEPIGTWDVAYNNPANGDVMLTFSLPTKYVWIGSDNGFWSEDSNWNVGLSPGAQIEENKTVIINSDVTVILNIDVINLGTIVICSDEKSQSDAVNPIGGRIQVNSLKNLDNQGEIWIYSTGTTLGALVVSSSCSFENNGTLEVVGGSIINWGSFTNTDTLQGKQWGLIYNAEGVFDNTGTINLHNAFRFYTRNAGTISSNHNIINIFDEAKIILYDAGEFTNSGTINMDQGVIWVGYDSSTLGSIFINNNSGTINYQSIEIFYAGGVNHNELVNYGNMFGGTIENYDKVSNTNNYNEGKIMHSSLNNYSTGNFYNATNADFLSWGVFNFANGVITNYGRMNLHEIMENDGQFNNYSIIYNHGQFGNGDGQSSALFNNEVGGELTFVFDISDGSWVNQSTSIINNAGTITNNNGGWNYGTINNSNVFINGSGTLNNSGVFNNQVTGELTFDFYISSGSWINASGCAINNAGTITNNNQGWNHGTINNSNVFINGQNGVLHNSGDFNNTSGIFSNEGTLGGQGTFTGNLVNSLTGIVTPGDSPGLLTVNGNFTNNGTLKIEVGGISFDLSGTKEYDRLAITDIGNNVTLSGRLEVELINSFAPVNGDEFLIITTASGTPVSGTFTTIPATLWLVMYNYPTVGDVTIVYQNALPLTLMNFDAELQNRQVLLSWKVESEINNAGFEIQRLTDHPANKYWTSLGFMANDDKHEYTFIDEHPESGINQYRLKIIDSDGKFEYSHIKSVSFVPKEAQVTIYPNPATDIVYVRWSLKEKKGEIKILNTAGKVIYHQKCEFNASGTTINFNDTFSSGIYFVKVFLEDRCIATEKLFVQ